MSVKLTADVFENIFGKSCGLLHEMSHTMSQQMSPKMSSGMSHEMSHVECPHGYVPSGPVGYPMAYYLIGTDIPFILGGAVCYG